MKTISLEVDDQIYQQVVGFLHLLPKDRCRIFDEDDSLSPEALAAVQAIQARLREGDESDFSDWDDVKDRL